MRKTPIFSHFKDKARYKPLFDKTFIKRNNNPKEAYRKGIPEHALAFNHHLRQ